MLVLLHQHARRLLDLAWRRPSCSDGTFMATMFTAGILSICPAFSQPEEIRSKLLARPVWAYEWTQPHPTDPHGAEGKVTRGKAWFEEKDGKLIGYLDDGWKCDSEVKLQRDGFDMETCPGGEKQLVLEGDEFKATFGSYVYAFRPMR